MASAAACPSCLMTTLVEVTKKMNTAIMMRAAPVMTRPVLARPAATASWWSRVRSQVSLTRDSRKTS
jgi:hypothetical protein